jgi:hypothetical protein
MSEDLLPCPFCGAEPQLKDVTTAGDRLPPVYAAVCPGCQITTRLHRWNHRTPPPATKVIREVLRVYFEPPEEPGPWIEALIAKENVARFLTEWGE